MIEKAKVVKADFYISKKGVYQVETLELEIEIPGQEDSKVILVKGRLIIDAVHQVITLQHCPVGVATLQEYVSELEGLSVRVDIVDDKIVALMHHLKKYFVFVKDGEVVF